MDSVMEDSVVLATPGKARKRLRDPSKWKKTKSKLERYRPKNFPSHPKCNHKKSSFACGNLSMQDIRRFHQKFYDNTTKIEQDNFILKHTTQNIPKRRRLIKGTRNNSVSVTYFIKTKNGSVSICSKAFISILGISRFRVQNIAKRYLIDALPPTENRGDKISKHYADKREKVKEFILELKCVQSHYTRNKSESQYMSSDLSIRQLWKSYCDENKNLPVKYDYFREIFTKHFNIGFKSPATDACSECIRLKGLMTGETNTETKNKLMCLLRVHKLKAKVFYDALKIPVENTIKLSFDCQKNMVLPRVPDQSAYYSRQLYLYNFTICEGNSNDKQTKQCITSYTWTENVCAKGSNEICSMVNHKLSMLDLVDVTSIKLFCDGCPGQNKNVTMMGMLMCWLHHTNSTVDEIIVTFPIVGHSFLPADRAFGRIEKKVKKKEVIVHPDEYRMIFSEYATVLDLETDCQVFNWKKAIQAIVKPPGQWHFQFATAKRISIFKKRNPKGSCAVFVKGEINYKSDFGVYKSVLKKGQNFAKLNLEPLPKQCAVKQEKLKDVDALLKKHYGLNWRDLQNVDLTFYKNIIDNATESSEDPEVEEIVHIEEDDGLHI